MTNPLRRWARRFTRAVQEDEVLVVGVSRAPLRDIYFRFLRMSWSAALLGIVTFYLCLNVLFALGYDWLGGVSGARAGSFADAFYFSIQTLGTIGYGSMYPQGTGAHLLVVAESVTGLLVTAVCTGLVFAKFSLSGARIEFTRNAVISSMQGVPTLMFRVGNQRGNLILEAQLRAVLLRTERTLEGQVFYRMYDLVLSRDRSPAISRSWTVLHPITEGSPLHGQTPETLRRQEVEIIATVVGTDDTSLQPVHARHRYHDGEVVWGARHADVLSEDGEGRLVMDLGRFHDLVPTEPSESFPYPRGG